MTNDKTRHDQTLGRVLGLGAFVGASAAGSVVFADMVLAFVSAFQAVPAGTDFAVYELSVIALIAIALGVIAGGLSGVLVFVALRVLRGRSKSAQLVATVILVSVPPGVISAACARLLITHANGAVNAITGLVVGAIASGLFAVLGRTEQRRGSLAARRWRWPLLICGVIGLAMGSLLGLSRGLFTQFDLASMGEIYIFSPDFFDPMVPLTPTILGDAGLGASVGLIAAWLAVSFAYLTQRFTSKNFHSLVTYAAALFIVVGGAGLVGARLNGLFYPSWSSVLSQDNGILIAVGDKSAWPQAVLTGIEWGICAAAVGIVLFVGLSQRRWLSRWRLFVIGIFGGAVVAGLLALSIWAETSIWATGVNADDARAVAYPALLGISIAIGLGALAGLLAVMTTNALIVGAGRWVTPRRAALTAMGVVMLIGGLPLLHLAIYPDGTDLLPDALPLAFNSGIVLLMLAAAALVAARWSGSTNGRDPATSDATLTEHLEGRAQTPM